MDCKIRYFRLTQVKPDPTATPEMWAEEVEVMGEQAADECPF
jgi:hypothetical protein